jgi:hypothetical protein
MSRCSPFPRNPGYDAWPVYLDLLGFDCVALQKEPDATISLTLWKCRISFAVLPWLHVESFQRGRFFAVCAVFPGSARARTG